MRLPEHVVKAEAPFGGSECVEDHAASRVERRAEGPAVGSRHDVEVALVRALPRNERQAVEPARPMAVVPTGIPEGICTIDSNESIPLSAADCTGTPSTGSNVFAATIPGK